MNTDAGSVCQVSCYVKLISMSRVDRFGVQT